MLANDKNSCREVSWQFPISQIGFLPQCGLEPLVSLKAPFPKQAMQNNFQVTLFLDMLYTSLIYRENIHVWMIIVFDPCSIKWFWAVYNKLHLRE